MRRTVKRVLLGALIGGGLAFAGATVAQAAETSGDDGTASGTQALIGVTLPVTIGGNGISILGDSSSADASTPAPAPAPATPAITTGGTDGIASGTQGLVSVTVPVTVGGNAISVLGDSGSTDAAAPAPAPAQPAAAAPAPSTSGADGVLGGTQAVAPVQVPVTVSGNAISLLGDSQSTDATTANGTAPATGTQDGTGSTTTGDDGIAGGTQVQAPVQAPITLGGNAISVLGDSQSTDAGTMNGTAPTTGTGSTTTGDDGIAGGTQVQAPIQAPITLGGNAISVLGDSQSTNSGTTTGTGTTGTGTGSTDGATTTGDDGIAGGSQVIAPIGAPITAGGNAISVLGDSQSTGSAVSAPATAGAGTPITGGTDSVLGGTQIAAPIALPITLGGNAISVVGDTTTGTTVPTGPVVPTDPTVPTNPTVPTDPTVPVTLGTVQPADGAATVGSAAALSATALALTGSTPGGLWIALLALIAGIALVGASALRRHTARV